ncbi:coxsackievirus and adenovirus receptor homolog [Oreochromis aureus]|uniref:coxsackievirus and adenovirus receptor homolog n=1 Tax=Oreochromis aureus TaxID=47969 RepID=UPI001954D761|nr:coxsackievirus and adenovirus receptor homolog [Oreochromis aureus]
MSAVTASLCSTLLFVGLFVFVSADQKNITAKSGQNVTLTCRAPNNNIGVIEWKKADLKEEYVLLYRDGHFDPDHQHPSFKNRVDLQDRQMKDGDMSLILKYVTINDTGTYECRVQKDGDSLKSISNITLSVVVPPGQPGGHTEDGGKEDGFVGLIVGLSVGVIVVVGGGLVIYRRYKQQSQSHRPNAEPKTEMSESFLNSESSAAEHKDK